MWLKVVLMDNMKATNVILTGWPDFVRRVESMVDLLDVVVL
jgi:hypothetical protein